MIDLSRMATKYPESVEAHVKVLRWEFHNALAATKGVRTKRPVPEHVSNLIRSGIRKGIAEGLSQGKCDNFPSKQAQKEVGDLIHSQIISELYGQLQDSMSSDVVPRTMLRSIHASFSELSHKYTTQAAKFAARVHFADANQHTAPASPAETVPKMEGDSGSPYGWQLEQDDLVSSKDDDNVTGFKIMVSLANEIVDRGINNEELTRLVNQSIGSDPEIPSHLIDSEWITGASLLDSGTIEVHVETEDDRDFLTFNTHWRPKLEQTLAARDEMYCVAMDMIPFGKMSSMLRAREASAIARMAHHQIDQWEQGMTETERHSPTIWSSSRREQASQAVDRGFPKKNRRPTCPTFLYNNQREGYPTTE